MHKVFRRHFFFGHEERQQPKQQRGTCGAEAQQVHGSQYVGVGDVLAANDVEPEDAVGAETREVPDNCRFVQSHRLFFKRAQN